MAARASYIAPEFAAKASQRVSAPTPARPVPPHSKHGRKHNRAMRLNATSPTFVPGRSISRSPSPLPAPGSPPVPQTTHAVARPHSPHPPGARSLSEIEADHPLPRRGNAFMMSGEILPTLSAEEWMRALEEQITLLPQPAAAQVLLEFACSAHNLRGWLHGRVAATIPNCPTWISTEYAAIGHLSMVAYGIK